MGWATVLISIYISCHVDLFGVETRYIYNYKRFVQHIIIHRLNIGYSAAGHIFICFFLYLLFIHKMCKNTAYVVFSVLLLIYADRFCLCIQAICQNKAKVNGRKLENHHNCALIVLLSTVSKTTPD